jgi:hypothetical protein
MLYVPLYERREREKVPPPPPRPDRRKHRAQRANMQSPDFSIVPQQPLFKKKKKIGLFLLEIENQIRLLPKYK